ncbi:MAG: FecR domain-containing protein [Novosphingobium sp.]|nr:FecR domain-containing protein [Novosphingobium sp.]
MAAQRDERIRDDAIAWHLRLAQGNDADWEPFVAWLEADERHNRAYEAVVDSDTALDGVIDEMATAREAEQAHAANVVFPEVSSRRRSSWRLRVFATAASVALVAGGALFTYGQLDDSYEVKTAAGEMRTFALADGTRIAMNGETRLVLHHKDPRSAKLVSGEARFTVHHDAERPFTLEADGQRIVDIGTVFNVQKTKRVLRVEVAEGAVRFVDGDVRLRLDAGDTLEARASTIKAGTRPVSAIGT